MNQMSWQEAAARIDLAELHVDTRERDLRLRCLEADRYHIPVVLVNPVNVSLTKQLCMGLNIEVAAAVSYPVGAYFPEVKAQEISDAVEDGADQIYMIMAVGAFLDGWLENQTLPEINYLVEKADGRPTKLVTEISVLSQEERYKICDLAMEQGVDYLVTTTDFDRSNLSPVSVDDLHYLREYVQDDLKLIHKSKFVDPSHALECFNLGISRLCTENPRPILQQFEGFQWM